MADTAPTGFRHHSYRRVCDVCGNLRPIEEMHRQDDLWVCTYDAGERVRTRLDRLNARERPFALRPVPNPKPQNPYYPNTLETDDDAVFNFLSRQVAAQCRYESVDSGSAALTGVGQGISGLSWAGRYFYDLIQANDRRAALITQAKTLLGQIATYLLTRQQGAGLSPSSTRTSDAFFGGFLESGASTWVTEDTATAGLALLYAYRILGTASYLQGARNAASYLRNVQAIGSNGTHYTSSDSGGSGRLYTGSLASEVSTASGFFSNSLFYPSALLALEFWNELKTTDGDQSLGSTGTPTGFTTAPAALLSVAIADIRDCWSTGIRDKMGALINGFSSTTPFEYFNAYPATKTNFAITGTGLWEFFDDGNATGTQITSQTFSRALSSLYSYEGPTTQVTTISDWLRSFTSNPDFETAANTSTSVLYRSTTGTYDPTICLATVLTVRDANNAFAATKVNGSSVYDWGSFGLMSRIWANRNRASFLISRLYPLNVVQRYFDGSFNDGLTSDRVILRGLSGLTMQTAFGIVPQTTVPIAYPPSRMGRGSDLIFDSDGIDIPEGELTTRGYWRFTIKADTFADVFPYLEAAGEIPVGGAVVIYNGLPFASSFDLVTGGPTNIPGQIPFSLQTTPSPLTVPNTVAVQLFRNATTWRESTPAMLLPQGGQASPITMVNDAVRAAQFGRSFREART